MWAALLVGGCVLLIVGLVAGAAYTASHLHVLLARMSSSQLRVLADRVDKRRKAGV